MTTHYLRAIWIPLAIASIVAIPSMVNAATCKNVDMFVDNKTNQHLKALFANFKCAGENERKEMFKQCFVSLFRYCLC